VTVINLYYTMEYDESMDIFDVNTGEFDEEGSRIYHRFLEDIEQYHAEREVARRMLQLYLNQADESGD
jgi:hypothetical protein